MRVSHLLPLLLIAACAQEQGPEPEAATQETVTEEAAEPLPAPTLEQLWVADGFASPEGSAAAPQGGYFISNVSGGPRDKDGVGWISLISEDGEIITEKFADGLDSPKGVTVLDGVLYAADLSVARMIDAATGEALGDIPVEGAQMLNDATVWNGAVYMSDTDTQSIYKIEDGAASLWITDERLERINGVLGAGDKLYILTMEAGALFEADADGSLVEIASGMIRADGVGLVEGGGWLVSTVPGGIYYVSPDGEPTQLADSSEAGISQNDLNVYGDTAIVPNWRPGTVTAWKITR